MTSHSSASVSRRTFVLASAALLARPAFSAFPAHASAVREYRLTAAPGRVPLVGGEHPETAVWAYNGAVPGPEIRAWQGERLRIVVENKLDEETTVHWHGIRVPNAMDGVPHLTQKPIAPGASFTYEFDVPDAGTYWYHPHQRSFEQVGRGLYGPLIVEEREPIAVDREFYWVLDDWRLQADAQISGDFGNMMDMSHNGRIGNTATVNGRIRETFEVRRGERIRLRLINAANARTFALDFAGHAPRVIAFDGQPVEPHAPAGGRIVLGAAMRADLVIDMTGKPGERFRVSDTFYRGLEYRLLDLVYAAEPLRDSPPDAPVALAPNTMPEPDLKAAERHEVAFGGGMMGGMMTAMMGGRRMDMREMMQNGMAWTVNGVAATGHMLDPFLTLARGRSYLLAMHNDTAWHHPIHLHGHAFRVISRNGQPTRYREWQDTVLLSPRERAEIAFVADNAGDWMFHCHILEHQAAGMMGVIRVA
ncbi:MAG: multicopper oxidase domain-containing protein [Alphaproteobacteria bacterium]|nr:multicopper oxidase domain-containing protein [Alphaproteobacteria bacterium]